MSKKKLIGFIVLFTAVWTLTPFVTSSHGYIFRSFVIGTKGNCSNL